MIAVQETANTGGKTLPTSAVQGLGGSNFASVAANTAYALIGYKGTKSVDWKTDMPKADGSGPAEVSAIISIDCSYMPLGNVEF